MFMVMMMFSFQNEGNQNIGNQADGGNDQHGNAPNFIRVYEALDGFPPDADADDGQGNTIDQGSKYFHPVIPICMIVITRFFCHPEGAITDHQRQYVCKNMGAIRKQCQAACPNAADDLSSQDNTGDQNGIKIATFQF